MLDLEEIRLKDVSEITDPDEQKLITDNWRQLTTEEQTAFSDFKPEEGTKDKGFTFKSEDEFNQKVRDAAVKIRQEEKEEEERQKKEAEDKAKGDQVPDFVAPDYKPTSWNEAAKVLFPKFRDAIKDAVIKEISNMSVAQRQKLDEIDKGFDDEIIQIRKDNPDLPAKGTKEGDEFESELAGIGVEYKVTNMADSYKIYKAVHGKKEVPQGQRNLVAKISGGGGEPTPTSGLKYSRLRKPLDERIEEGLEKTS